MAGNGDNAVNGITQNLERVDLTDDFDFATLPGFTAQVEAKGQEGKVKFASLSKIDDMIAVNCERFPSYRFDEQSIKDRQKQRNDYDAQKVALDVSRKRAQRALAKAEKNIKAKEFRLNRANEVLTLLEKADDNITVLLKEREETLKWFDAETAKAEKRQRLETIRHKRSEKYEETIVVQDYRRKKAHRRQEPQCDETVPLEEVEGLPNLIDLAGAA